MKRLKSNLSDYKKLSPKDKCKNMFRSPILSYSKIKKSILSNKNFKNERILNER